MNLIRHLLQKIALSSNSDKRIQTFHSEKGFGLVQKMKVLLAIK